MGRWTDRLPTSPVSWLLDKACAPIRYRVLTEILRKPAEDWDVMRAREGANGFPPAVLISRTQQDAGTWLNRIFEFEPPSAMRKRGPGMLNQFLALTEFGWDISHPIMHQAAELLFRYAEGDLSTDIFELKGYAGANKTLDLAVRKVLARMSAAVLARVGAGADPRVAAAAERVLVEVEAQYVDPATSLYDGEIEIEDEGTFLRLRPDAVPPEMFLMYLFAFTPSLRTTERGKAAVDRIVTHLFDPHPHARMIQEVAGKRLFRWRLPRIADLGRADFADKKIGYLLHDLDLLARTGTLLGHRKAIDLLEWVLTLVDADGVFRPDEALEKCITPSLYHWFPIEDSWRGKHRKFTDITFRVLLILTLLDEAEAAAPR